jgi:hypothetical protein
MRSVLKTTAGKKFDLVTAINSPGIHDRITQEKMIEASKGYCFLSNFVDRTDSVQDILRTEILKLEEISVNGFVMGKVRTKTAWIYWKV